MRVAKIAIGGKNDVGKTTVSAIWAQLLAQEGFDVLAIDALIVVVEPGSRSIETAVNIAKMARKLGIGCVGAIANKVTEAAQIDTILSQLDDIILLGTLKYSRLLQEADLIRAPVCS